VLFLERLCFSFQFSLVCCSSWLDHTMFVWERDTLHFHCLEHSSFTFYSPASVHFSLVLRLVFVLFRTC
jgi:hypothetical protein